MILPFWLSGGCVEEKRTRKVSKKEELDNDLMLASLSI